jgi:ferredoxin, 2Fe-2S
MDVRVSFQPSGRSLRVACGTNLLEAIRRAGLPIARACGAEGLCGRCGVRPLAGAEALGAETPMERSAKARNRVAPDCRLACRVAVAGDVEVTAPYW